MVDDGLPTPITKWDWPDTVHIPDGYDMTLAPAATTSNLQFLADKYNELLALVLSSDSAK
jgi:uncharacterized protein YbdZ (MbtH family)